MIGSPSVMSLFGLMSQPDREDLEKCSTEELRMIDALETQRLRLMQSSGTIAGVVGGGVGGLKVARWILG